MTQDPYRPPLFDGIASDFASEPDAPAPLATRGQRLAAYLLDFVFGAAVMLPIVYALGEFDEAASPPPESFAFALTVSDVASSFALFVVMNGYFLVKNGQTIGKRMIGIRVVNVSDRAPTPFWKLVFVRHLPQLLLCLIPFVGIWLSFGELLLVARADRRTGHDLWTGTCVVKVMKV